MGLIAVQAEAKGAMNIATRENMEGVHPILTSESMTSTLPGGHTARNTTTVVNIAGTITTAMHVKGPGITDLTHGSRTLASLQEYSARQFRLVEEMMLWKSVLQRAAAAQQCRSQPLILVTAMTP